MYKEIRVNEEMMRRCIEEYVDLTGFPNATEKIKSHFAAACEQFNKRAGENIVLLAFCDEWCSVGHRRNMALPGSDLDGLTILRGSSLVSDEELVEGLGRFLDSRIVDLPSVFFTYICAADDFHELLARMDVSDQYDAGLRRLLLGKKTIGVLEGIRGGTLLYVGVNEDLMAQYTLLCKDSRFDHLFSDDFLTFDKNEPKGKDMARKRLFDLFPSFSDDLKYFVVRLMKSYSALIQGLEAEKDLDLSVFGPNGEVFLELEKLGLVSKRFSTMNGAYFAPLWE